MISIYSAQWILPIVTSPIENSAVAIEGQKIVAVGPSTEVISRFPAARVSDFGKAAILPGLVNAHSHLELTAMRGFLEAEEQDFFAWLRKLTVARMAMTPEDLFVSAACGAIEAARAGVTCLGDSSSEAAQSMKALSELGLRAIVYQESFGPDPKLASENVAKLRDKIGELRAFANECVGAGVSPHAPYTVSGPQLELISRLAIDEQLPLMMHAAESKAEAEFLLDGTGVFAEGLRSRGIDWQAPRVSTIEYLAERGVLDTKPLLAHCININDRDIELIKEHDGAIAHCPKSNAKLGHGCAPFTKFMAAGLKVGFGSDSVASNNNCDIFEEARFATLMARASTGDPAFGPISADQALFAATLGGARALRLDDRVGCLSAGMQADLIAVGLSGRHQQPARNPVSALIFSSSALDVRMTMVAGKEIYRDGLFSVADELQLHERLRAMRTKLEASVQS